jgi:metal-sulfur cluster biosynthetic enzyme
MGLARAGGFAGSEAARALQVHGRMTEQEIVQELVRAARDVIDPETGLDILDMGLVLHVGYTASTRVAHVVMTLTTPSCPSGGVMVEGLERSLARVEGVGSVKVDVTFEVRWTPERITPEGREALGWR